MNGGDGKQQWVRYDPVMKVPTITHKGYELKQSVLGMNKLLALYSFLFNSMSSCLEMMLYPE